METKGKCIDLTGQRFGRLTVIERVETPTGHGRAARWKCVCDCGNITEKPTTSMLRSGQSTSCGCLRQERSLEVHSTHGDGHHKDRNRLYQIWADMKHRCNSPKARAWKNYGGRGIKVCEAWNHYEMFKLWALANGYQDNLTLDRIDVNGDYEPSNCRWATYKQQANNTRKNINLTLQGKTQSLQQWAEELGIPRTTIVNRLRRGWSVEDALKKDAKEVDAA